MLEDPRLTFVTRQTAKWSHVLHALFSALAADNPALVERSLDNLLDLKAVLAPHGGSEDVDSAIEVVRGFVPKSKPSLPEPPAPNPAPSRSEDPLVRAAARQASVAVELLRALTAEQTMSDRAFMERVRGHLAAGCEMSLPDQDGPIREAFQMVDDMLNLAVGIDPRTST